MREINNWDIIGASVWYMMKVEKGKGLLGKFVLIMDLENSVETFETVRGGWIDVHIQIVVVHSSIFD